MKKFLFILPLLIVSACANEPKQINVNEENYISEADAARYRDNIIEKRRGPSYVSYEYRDVRIDELTPLAVHYCRQKDANTTAQLREIIMRENHSRLATFDCMSLQ
ncbi:MAG: hypothetical protein IJ870_02725 [Alphaproteobacteria bacterium]|nr:hypothetical protein [Alphaproteobacteria bacterium]